MVLEQSREVGQTIERELPSIKISTIGGIEVINEYTLSPLAVDIPAALFQHPVCGHTEVVVDQVAVVGIIAKK